MSCLGTRATTQHSRVLLIVLCLGLLVGARPAASQTSSASASELDRQGREAFAQGSYERAARAFEEACRVQPHPSTRYNAALAWEKAGQMARAADDYEAALAMEGLDAARTKASQSRLASLKQLVGLLSVTGPLGGKVSVDGTAGVPIPARIHLAPGSHEVFVTTVEGTTIRTLVNARAGETTEHHPTAPEQPSPTPAKPIATSLVKSPESNRTLGWVTLGGAAVFSAAAVVLGVSTLRARDEFDDSGRRDADARDQAIAYRLWTNVSWGAALVSGAVAGWLLLRPEPNQGAAKTEVSLGLGTISTTLRF